LRIPAYELRQICAVGVGETGDKILDRRRVPVMPLEIKVHAAAEARAAEQHAEHAHHLGAFFVDRRGVEVVDLVIERRPHRVGEGACVLDELIGAQPAHVDDALDRARALIGGELLVAEDGEAFLQAELEPVAAGDAVAGPVVKILVRDHRLDAGIVGVGRRLRARQHVFVVENVQALVLHRPHVEIGHGDDHENVEVVFAAKFFFVPAHGAFEAVERVAAALLLAGLDVDAQLDVAAGHRFERCGDAAELAADQCEQITRLREGIVPDREVAVGAGDVAAAHEVAVREQHRRFVLLRLDAGRVDGHHVGPVGEIGDTAEALGLALGAVGAARAVEAHELGIGRGIDQRFDVDRERPRRRRKRKAVGRRRVAIGRERRAVKRKAL